MCIHLEVGWSRLTFAIKTSRNFDSTILSDWAAKWDCKQHIFNWDGRNLVFLYFSKTGFRWWKLIQQWMQIFAQWWNFCAVPSLFRCAENPIPHILFQLLYYSTSVQDRFGNYGSVPNENVNVLGRRYQCISWCGTKLSAGPATLYNLSTSKHWQTGSEIK